MCNESATIQRDAVDLSEFLDTYLLFGIGYRYLPLIMSKQLWFLAGMWLSVVGCCCFAVESKGLQNMPAL